MAMYIYSSPTKDIALKKKYIEKIEEMRDEEVISNTEYFILKHHKIIDEELVRGTYGLTDNITNDSVLSFIDNFKTLRYINHCRGCRIFRRITQ